MKEIMENKTEDKIGQVYKFWNDRPCNLFHSWRQRILFRSHTKKIQSRTSYSSICRFFKI